MKKLNKITITADEAATLKAAQLVAEIISARFCDANGGRWMGRLDMKMEVVYSADDVPHAWWTVHPYLDMLQSGHHMTLEGAFAEMHGRTDGELKRYQAARYKAEAERLEAEARQIEAANEN